MPALRSGRWAAGSAIGFVGGALVAWPILGTLAGGAIGLTTAAVVDARRGHRLLRWLRGGQQAQAPRDTGFWGELGYWAEKGLRGRERSIEEERRRLEQFLSAMEASPNGVMLLDANEQIDWCNTVAADHFGLNPDARHGAAHHQPGPCAGVQGLPESR